MNKSIRAVNYGRSYPVSGAQDGDTSSGFYKPNQKCAYHSNSILHDTKDCIYIKQKIQDVIDQKVVFLQTSAQCQH